MPKLFSKAPPTIADAPEDHRISMRSMEYVVNETTHVVLMEDLASSEDALNELKDWLKSQGYFLHCVKVEAPTPTVKTPGEAMQHVGPGYLMLGGKKDGE